MSEVEVKSTEERKARLDEYLHRAANAGWRIEDRSDLQATIAKGKRVNYVLRHVLHPLLLLAAFRGRAKSSKLRRLSLWLIPWVIIGMFGGVRRRLITINEQGEPVVHKV